MAIDLMGAVLVGLGVVFSTYYTFWLFFSPYILADANSNRIWGTMFPLDNYWAKVIPLYALVMLMSFLGIFTGIVIVKAKSAVDNHHKKK